MKDLATKRVVDGENCDLKASQGFLQLDDGKVKIRKEPITDFYDVEQRPFARGKFATVRKCKHKESGIDYAAKFIRKRRRAVDVRHEILHEIAVLDLSQPSHHIVNLMDVYETNSELILVLELVTGGELQRILDEEEVISEDNVIKLMKEILEGVSFLHDNNIAHLDIKPQNLLLTGEFPDCGVKLCDFGISRLVRGDVEIRDIVGTPDYIAPEVLHYEPISVATDLWSIGILAYVLLSGHSPFGGESKQETFCNITQSELDFPSELFTGVSSTAKDFIRNVLVRDPKMRPTVEESLNHRWLRSALDVKSEMVSCIVDSPMLTRSLHQDDNATDVALSSDTSSMDSSIPETNEQLDNSEMDMIVNSSCAKCVDESDSNRSARITPTDEVHRFGGKTISTPDVQANDSKNQNHASSGINSRRYERLRGSCLDSSLHEDNGYHNDDDNKENIRLHKVSVTPPPPVIHSLSPSLVRSTFVRNAIAGFTSGRSMSNLSADNKSLSNLLTTSPSRAHRSTSVTTNRNSGSQTRTTITSRKIRISSDETELRISKTSVVVIDEDVCF